ncbi:MAG: hypothetical protein PHP25_01220 [Candidatus Moranbacteria bacterium]|nr:hypothetical protein [Candidatus Moranbacteria bacterium]
MNIKTLIIGFIPLKNIEGKKPREIRNDKYFKELISRFDIGEIHFAEYDNFKGSIDKIDPFFVIVFDEMTAREVRDHKKDIFIYVIDHPNTIFCRKAEVEKKQAKQTKTFEEIAGLVKKIRDDGEDGRKAARKFAGMSYDDMYNTLVQAIIGDREDLRKKAWELLTQKDGHSNFVWMRVQMICEVWTHGDGKKKEEFLCMAMDQHIENGMARKMENFIDADGQEFHQYMFLFFDGSDSNYIRRIPFGREVQDKYEYEAILQKYETPNGPQLMLEAGQIEAKRAEYLGGTETNA